MKKTTIQDQIRNEQGVALVMAILLLAILAILSATAYQSTSNDMTLSRDLRKKQEAFYFADGSTDIGPGIIERAYEYYYNNSTAITFDTTSSDYGLTIRNDDHTTTDVQENLFKELIDYELTDPSVEVKIDETEPAALETAANQPKTDIAYSVGNYDVAIDIDYIGTKRLGGGSTESQSRYEGIGSGGSAIADRYRIHSLTKNRLTSQEARVETMYQRIDK